MVSPTHWHGLVPVVEEEEDVEEVVLKREVVDDVAFVSFPVVALVVVVFRSGPVVVIT
jgi:hypothetical protein